MQGEYRGDFTRDTFNQKKHFLRVLRQQGRITVDADFNEQVAILLHYLQSLAADLIGNHGGVGDAFKIVGDSSPYSFNIQAGHYYVDGILCENNEQITYAAQSGYPFPDASALDKNKTYLVYLDVWERHITYIEDDSIREVALGGPDTATRAKVVWQVKVTNKGPKAEESISDKLPASINKWRDWVDKNWSTWMTQWQPTNRGMLKARVKPQDVSTDPCITSPESRYRGAENQLYRVEIHKGGTAWNGKDDNNGENAKNAATFKWSRDNGSVIFPIRRLEGKVATLEHLGRDDRLTLKKDDWVEIVDDDYALRGEGGPLVQVGLIDRVEMTVTFRSDPGLNYDEMREKHPLLRHWDHKAGDLDQGGLQLQDGAVLIEEGKDENGWLELEDGIQIQFQPPPESQVNKYRTGDYWLIPARTATGNVEWPTWTDTTGKAIPVAESPHGVEHHYAPLWIISVGPDGKVTAGVNNNLRRKIRKIWE